MIQTYQGSYINANGHEWLSNAQFATTTQTVPPTYNFAEELRRSQNFTVKCEMDLCPSAPAQPSPIVEGSLVTLARVIEGAK